MSGQPRSSVCRFGLLRLWPGVNVPGGWPAVPAVDRIMRSGQRTTPTMLSLPPGSQQALVIRSPTGWDQS